MSYYYVLYVYSSWNISETATSKEYVRFIVEECWPPKMTHNGEPWTGPDQYIA